MAEKTFSVDEPSAKWRELEEERRMCRCLDGGTREMRLRGSEYLPQQPQESLKSYETRLSKATLYDHFSHAIDVMTGIVFETPVELSEEAADDDLAEALADVDNYGNDLNGFAREAFRSGLLQGAAGILVDYEEAPEGEPPVTLAQQRERKLRPYLVFVRADQVIGWIYDARRGKGFSQVRIKETVKERAGEFGEVEVEQIRVLEPGHWRIFRKVETGDAGKTTTTWTVHSEGRTKMAGEEADVVPFVVIGDLDAPPPLRNIAYLNIKHWQSQSDQDNIVHVLRAPFLHGSGLDADQLTGVVAVGVDRMVKSSNPGAQFRWVEHSGSGIGAGKDHLDSLRNEMEALSIEFMTPRRPGDITATAEAIKKAEGDSALQVWAAELGRALNEALALFSRWIGPKAQPIEAKVNRSFRIPTADPTVLSTLSEMKRDGDLSRRTFWELLKDRAILPRTFDPKEEEKLLAAEPPKGFEDSREAGEETPVADEEESVE